MPLERRLKRKRVSNYQGGKRLNDMLEGLDSGRLKPAREPIHDILCPSCSYRKRSWMFVLSEEYGTRDKKLPFRHHPQLTGPMRDDWSNIPKGLIVCWDCAKNKFGANFSESDIRREAV